MYIKTIPNRSSPPAVLLRKCFREHGKPRKVTLANLSELSPRIIERMRRALKDEPDIRKLMDQKALQLSLFDKQNLAEITSPDYPGERLMACLNPALAQRRRKKRVPPRQEKAHIFLCVLAYYVEWNTKATERLAKTAEDRKGNVEEATFTVISDATPLQERALKLLGLYPVR